MRALETDVRALDGSIAIFDPKTLDAHIAERMDGERGMSRMLSVAGAIALALAALGLYGVVAIPWPDGPGRSACAWRSARARPTVVRLFVADAARLALTGLACGLPPAFAVTAMLSSTLVGARVGDPLALGAVTLLLAAVVLVAAYVPARRAMRVDPVVALRAE